MVTHPDLERIEFLRVPGLLKFDVGVGERRHAEVAHDCSSGAAQNRHVGRRFGWLKALGSGLNVKWDLDHDRKPLYGRFPEESSVDLAGANQILQLSEASERASHNPQRPPPRSRALGS